MKIISILIQAFLMVAYADANWDPSTGHAPNTAVSKEWLAKNKALRTMDDIQFSECHQNTRLHYPSVQLFAVFTVNHKQDGYHGCPYGSCAAYATFPSPKDLVPAFTDSHLLFWHNVGGDNSTAVSNPIADPQTGVFGYESSLSGQFNVGLLDTKTRQLFHDSKYPGFNENSLNKWTQAERDQFKPIGKVPTHPKCGRPCEPNKDPGQKPNKYYSYTPASADQYKPPASWKPSAQDTCFANGNSPSYSTPGNNTKSSSGKTKPSGPEKTKPSKPEKTKPSTPGKSKPPGDNGNSSPVPNPGSDNPSSKPSKHPKHSSGNHCKSFCKCLKKCQENNSGCDSCDQKNPNGCSKDECSKSDDHGSSRQRRCV